MSKIKPPFFNLSFLLILIGLASCSPKVHFDYGTTRQPTLFDRSGKGGPSASLTLQAAAGVNASGEEGNSASWSSGQEKKPDVPAAEALRTQVVLPVAPTKAFSAPPVTAEGKEILISRQKWKRTAKLIKNKTSQGLSLKKKGVGSPASPARNPFNQGILAAFLIFGLGIGFILLGSLLPPLGTILGWVVGVSILLVGVAFLALTLAGFSVRIIG
jgi:hypothetical protein